MEYLTLSFATRWFRVFCHFCVVLQQILCILCMIRFQFVLLPH